MSLISTATAKGLRPYQEDRFVASYILDGYLLAVMDGHGGSDVAELVSKKIENEFAMIVGTAEERIKTLFQSLHELTKDHSDGSTLSVVYLPDGENKAYVGVLGDSPVVIGILDETINALKLTTSPEHNVRSNPKEAQAVRDRGGYVGGGYAFAQVYGPGLQMSRALGDSALSSILSRDPDVYTVELNKTSFVLVATDGVFDPGHSETEAAISEIGTMIRSGCNAQDIVDRAVQLKTGDNATAILYRT